MQHRRRARALSRRILRIDFADVEPIEIVTDEMRAENRAWQDEINRAQWRAVDRAERAETRRATSPQSTLVHGAKHRHEGAHRRVAPADDDGDAPRPPVAVEFLRTILPHGPWALAAIDPDHGTIKCRTYGPDADAIARFIELHNATRNVYYQVNVVRPDLGKRRASKRDVRKCVALHVDIDPPSGVRDLAAWQRQTRRRLRHWRHEVLPSPHYVVFSGSGFQLIWRLPEASDDIEAVESRNLWIANDLGGDRGTWGVDRLLRLPGTLNHPGERKRRKYGRTGPVLAEVLS